MVDLWGSLSVILTTHNPLIVDSRLMQAAFDHAIEYVHDRKQFGQPVGTFQLMQGTLSNYRVM